MGAPHRRVAHTRRVPAFGTPQRPRNKRVAAPEKQGLLVTVAHLFVDQCPTASLLLEYNNYAREIEMWLPDVVYISSDGRRRDLLAMFWCTYVRTY
jgi:hypothetical protein